jgi:hypothetical protein
MNSRSHLLREAGKLASSQTARRIELWAEIARLQVRRDPSLADKAELERLFAEAENCGQALIRFGKYRPHEDTLPNCPHCWVVRGEVAALGEGENSGSYYCNGCGAKYP